MTKEEKIKELLAVLDMSEDEQCRYLYLNGFRNDGIVDCGGKGYIVSLEHDGNEEILAIKSRIPNGLKFNKPILADLAFRMKKKCDSPLLHVRFEIGRFHVYAHRNDKKYAWVENHCEYVDSWFIEFGTEIDFIIAAKIAEVLGE